MLGKCMMGTFRRLIRLVFNIYDKHADTVDYIMSPGTINTAFIFADSYNLQGVN